MKKSYKLIKIYPGCERLGMIVINREELLPNNYYSESTKVFMVSYPDKYPEFWELVVEKDYEILSLWNQGSEYPKLPNGNFGSQCCQISTSVMDQYPIYKIKRLSDGEIFTIGDKIHITFNKPDIIKELISFELKNHLYLNLKDSLGVVSTTMNNLEKIKQPLFKTEDGIDIFENDEFWSVTNQFELTVDSPIFITINNKDQINKKGYKTFSTKEKAEEYILMNKPCLSLNDYYSLFKEDVRDYGIGQKLQKIVKNKLQIK